MAETVSTQWSTALNYYNGGQFEAARAAATELIASKPTHAKAHQLLAVLLCDHNAAGGLEAAQAEALKHAQTAVALKPKNHLMLFTQGCVLERLGQSEEACDAFSKAHALQPQTPPLNATFLARAAAASAKTSQDPRTALTFAKVVEMDPGNVQARYRFAKFLRKTGQAERAAEQYGAVLELRPEHAQAAFWLAVVRSQIQGVESSPGPEFVPHELVKGLYDGYADHFDEHLTQKLHYRTPVVMAEVLMKHVAEGSKGEADDPGPRWARCMDLGCGTGLSGEVLRPLVRVLEGVDLSEGMVDRARRKMIYDDLFVDDIVHALEVRARPQCNGEEEEGRESGRRQPRTPYDLLVACDVIVYVGDLLPLFGAAANSSTEDAVLCVSVEELPEEASHGQSRDGEGQRHSVGSTVSLGMGYQLQPTGRYKHSRRYVATALERSGFSVLHAESSVLRHQKGEEVKGLVVVAQRRACV